MITNKFGQQQIIKEQNYLPDLVLFGNVKQTLAADEYFVLGDNRLNSSDSRKWGAVKRSEIVGRALIRAWPPTRLSYFLAPTY
jgi:signal peptidase I